MSGFKRKANADSIYPSDFPLDYEPFEVHYKKMMKMDQSLDFYLLRMSFTETEEYDPYNSELRELRSEMFKAFSEIDLDKILKYTSQVLHLFCRDFYAHFFNYKV